MCYFLRADDEGSFEDDEMVTGGETAFLAAATAAANLQKKTKGASTSSPGRLRKQEGWGNWADLFFVLDVMSGSIDVCEILVFISKTDPLVRQLEEKKVDPGRFLSVAFQFSLFPPGKSFVDSYNHKLTIAFTDVGSLEQLLGVIICISIFNTNCISIVFLLYFYCISTLLL